MWFGSYFSGFGDPDKLLEVFDVTTTATAIRVRLKAAAGFGDNYFAIYVNSYQQGYVWVTEGVISDWVYLPIPSTGEANVVALLVGSLTNAQQQNVTREHYEDQSNRVTATWDWTPEAIGTPDNAWLTGWSVSGVKRSVVDPGDRNTRGTIDVTLAVSGGTATVTLGALASGSGSVGGSVSLTALNGSGVTGSVTVAAAAVTSSATLVVRWPQTMQIVADGSNPPTTVFGTTPYNGQDDAKWTSGNVLAAGTYYFALRAVSDTDDIGDQQTAEAITIVGEPDAPDDVAYDSGNAAATTITWTASETVGATYNIYIQNVDDGWLDTGTAATTAAAGSTSKVLPAITGYPGVARVLVRAVSSGIEEQNGNVLEIEYDSSGNRVEQRPNTPVISRLEVDAGNTLNVVGVYDPDNEDGTATQLKLYSRTIGGAYDFSAAADATGSLGAIQLGVKRASLSKTYTNGYRYVTLKAATAGGTLSEESSPERLVYLSDVNVAAPSGDFVLSRG